jgi:hypothetical protein
MPYNRSGFPKRKAKRDKTENREAAIDRARRTQDELQKSYREQSLRIHPWICARCGREFTIKTLHLLTVHHKDHDHNPTDGSNWENLCLYCHDNEHRRYLDHAEGEGIGVGEESNDRVTHNPFAGLADLMKKND